LKKLREVVADRLDVPVDDVEVEKPMLSNGYIKVKNLKILLHIDVQKISELVRILNRNYNVKMWAIVSGNDGNGFDLMIWF